MDPVAFGYDNADTFYECNVVAYGRYFVERVKHNWPDGLDPWVQLRYRDRSVPHAWINITYEQLMAWWIEQQLIHGEL